MSLPSTAPRRISYVIPAPSIPPPRLVLPPLDTIRSGRTTPLVIPAPVSGDSNVLNEPALPSSTAAQPNPFFPSAPSATNHPRHRLGVSTLALDCSTQLEGKAAPEGILYAGGRDGLVTAWELGLPMKRRFRKYGAETSDRRRRLRRKLGTWETMTGWDDYDNEEAEDGDSSEDEQISSPWILGALEQGLDEMSPFTPGGGRPQMLPDALIPYESRWQVDVALLHRVKPKASFRQCVRSHTDWVNDIVLCNYNQTLISASSDGTVKAWNPHQTSVSADPSVIGRHGDYVRCLAYSPQQQWVASGSFDRTIKLWDIQHQPSLPATTPTPLAALSLPDTAAGPKASVYALATDLAGHVIAAGSPEKVVRTWDPRAGKKTGKLVGHTDNIRSIIISEDGRYLLTGSSDASIKLWSLAAQRCLHTFAHHTDSVWALFSNHPNLEIFYSGDRSGIVCKVDMEGSADVSEGECVVICREEGMGDEGINKIVAVDDTYVWTATGSSSIKRWCDPGRRATRAEELERPIQGSPAGTPSATQRSPSRDNSLGFLPGSSAIAASPTHRRDSLSPEDHVDAIPAPTKPTHKRLSFNESVTLSPHIEPEENTLFRIPFKSLVRLASFSDPYARTPSLVPGRARDPEVATLYSAASIRSVPMARHFPPSRPTAQSLHSAMRHASVSDTLGGVSSSSASGTGVARFVFPTDSVVDVNQPSARAEYEEREVASDAIPFRLRPDEIIAGSHGLVRSIILNDRMHALTVDTAGEVAIWDLIRGICLGVFAKEDVESASNDSTGSKATLASAGIGFGRSPREALESVRERIEGEGLVAPWATVDTRIGDLTVHLVEVKCFDAEVYMDEVGLSDMKGFSEEQRINVGKWILNNLFSGFVQAELRVNASVIPTSSSAPTSTGIHRAPAPDHISFEPSSTPRRARTMSDITALTSRTPGITLVLNTPALTPAILPELPLSLPPLSHSKETSTGTVVGSGAATPMPFSTNPAAMKTTSANVIGKESNNEPDYFSLRMKRSFHGRSVTDTDEAISGLSAATSKANNLDPPTPGGSFMGRLKSFGKNKRSQASESGFPTPAPILEGVESANEEKEKNTHPHLRYLDTLFSQPLSLPSELDAPPISLPPTVRILISEQTPDAGGWETVYHGMVSTSENDVEELEMASPKWLLECLFNNKGVQVPSPATKFSFVISPWTKGEGTPLPELLSSQAKLTANRVLRVRKILVYVKEKMDEIFVSKAEAPVSGTTTPTHQRTASKPIAVPTKDSPPASNPGVISSSPPNATSASSASLNGSPKAEDLYELLCNDVVLPVNMTLAAVRHYIWRQGGELSLQYRRKSVSV